MNYDTFKQICQEEGVDHKDALDEFAQQSASSITEVCDSLLRDWLRDTFKPKPAPHIEKVMQYISTIGGGFISRLAHAWFYADEDNREIIEREWSGVISLYRDLLIENMKQRKLFKEEEK